MATVNIAVIAETIAAFVARSESDRPKRLDNVWRKLVYNWDILHPVDDVIALLILLPGT
jgi:hypothetical protein